MKSRIADIIMSKNKPAMAEEESMEIDPMEGMMPEDEGMGGDEDGVMMAAADLIAAVKAEDHMGVANALRSAFEIMDSEPHVEGEHIEDEGEII